MSERVKLVIFDLDGTLINAYPAIVESFNFAMKALDLPAVKSSVIHRAVGWGDKNLLQPFVGVKNIGKALPIYRRHHQFALRRKTKFLPGAAPLLRKLWNKGYQLAVASNRPTKFSHIILEHLRVKRYFDYILCGDKVKKAKPHPDIILQILKRLNVKPAEAVYVGDMTVDIQAGKRAKVRTLAIVSASSTKKEILSLKPYKLIKNISQVSQVLAAMNGKATAG